MKQYKRVNNVLGWLMFLTAAVVYILTAEPTASFWDCGEYISTAYKLQVGHPPGAPLFQLMGRFFSLFAFGDVSRVAFMINIMSALFSAATIMFLFWTLTALASKIQLRRQDAPPSYSVFAAGIIGALAYTFSDSFWFSAVEGEVYATSSFFTAIVVWAMLKWDAVADEAQSWRWIIFIAFLMGLSIGVHLLNLLAIPAITFIYYFRKFKPSRKGLALTFGISLLLLAAIMYGIIPEIPFLYARTELNFVNQLGLPFNSGTIFFTLLLISGMALGLWFTADGRKLAGRGALALALLLAVLILTASLSVGDFVLRLAILTALAWLVWYGRNHRPALKTALLSLAFLMIGYSSFLVLVIRSNAEPPINENSPKDAISLLSYLNREQYGTWPIFYGQYYCAPLDAREPFTDGNPIYGRDEASGTYVVTDARKKTVENYDDRFCTLFPRMWSDQQEYHISGYQSWANIQGTPVNVQGRNGTSQTIVKPTFFENLTFFFRYQLGHMYFRYFMWNFAGRQNDIQGYGGLQNGNWISGIRWLDEMRLGPQANMPDFMKANKGRNCFFLLPLLLGLAGFFFQLSKDLRGWIVVFLLFLFTGFAINIYLNPVPYQPRERDYAYAASFYAFAIWIGLGVMWLINVLQKWLKGKAPVILAFSLSFVLVPALMAREGWDDHDRSDRYTGVDIASNYLNSCAPNAILFTVGDNDTFPLWYAQEVEGIRTDVRVVNLNLLGTDWYIRQMKRRVYDSAPLPLSLTDDLVLGSKREYTFIVEDTSRVPAGVYADLAGLMKFVASENPEDKVEGMRGWASYFPTSHFLIPVDIASVLKSGMIPPEFRDSVLTGLRFDCKRYGLAKSNLMVLDLLAHFNWERPVYFAVSNGSEAFLGLDQYFQLEGMAYRLMPFVNRSADSLVGRVNTSLMYTNMMEKFRWGNMDKPGVYLDETNRRICANMRSLFGRLAMALLRENRPEQAVRVCDRCVEVMPDENVPFDKTMITLISAYYKAGQPEKGEKVLRVLKSHCEQEIRYYQQFDGVDAAYVSTDLKEAAEVLKILSGFEYLINQQTNH